MVIIVLISLTQLIKGFEATKANAKILLRSAEILEANKQYSAATFLGFLSLEESAKAALIWKYKQQGRGITKTQWKRIFSKHLPKLRFIVNMIKTHGIELGVDLDLEKVKIEDYALFQQWVKEKLMYVDYDFQKRCWTNPSVGSLAYSKVAISHAKAGLKLLSKLV